MQKISKGIDYVNMVSEIHVQVFVHSDWLQWRESNQKGRYKAKSG
jgi:hypothetical protein